MIVIKTEKLNEIINNFSNNYRIFGYGPLSLEMPSDRRNIRYYDLIKNFPFFFGCPEKFCILDVGCGYGDLIDYLDKIGVGNYSYIGIDLCKEFLEYASNKYKDKKNVKFINTNFIETDFGEFEFDYAIFSQTFNDKYSDYSENNMELIQSSISKIFNKCNRGISFNFVTNKVQFKKNNVAYHSIEDIISFSYSLSNNIVLDNSSLPFEATLTIMKDISSDGLVWDSFKAKHVYEFANGTFVVNKKE